MQSQARHPSQVLFLSWRGGAPFDEVIFVRGNGYSSREFCALVAFRDTLLLMLISGELRVKNVEKFIEGISV